MNALLVSLAALSLTAAASLRTQSQPAGKQQTRQIFVSVTDRSGPVLDLGAADFEISEEGATRQVVRAALAHDPMRVALLIDTSEGTTAALNHMRAGLVAFLDALPPQHEVMLVTTGRQVRVRVPPTTDRKKVRDAASGLFSDGGATPLMDALLEIDERFLRKADDRWPVFVIVTGDGAEVSAGANEKKFNNWLRALPSRGVSAHAISLKYKGGGMPEIIASHVAETVGGRYDFMNTSNALPEKLKGIADQMARDFERAQTKYAITFVTDSADVRPVSVGVARDGVKLEMTTGRIR